MKAALPLLVTALMLSACVPSAKPPVSARAPTARPAPRPVPSVVQAPMSNSWMDAALTPGEWRYLEFGAGMG
jgi:hypothetical protein